MMEQLLDAAEVAALLRVSRELVYLFAKRGELRSVRIGTTSTRPRVLFQPKDVQDFIEKRAA
jgi:excisionase family DNA binding protein